MSLFGNLRIPQSAAQSLRPDKYGAVTSMQGEAGSPVRRGLFGGAFSGKQLPRTLQILGVGLQQASNNRGQLNQFSANEAEMQAREMAQSRQHNADYEARQERNQIEQIITQLPPEQQRLARLDPEGFVRGLLRQQTTGANAWQNDGTVPYRIDESGNVVMGSGSIPHRPRSPLIQYGTPGDAEDWDYNE